MSETTTLPASSAEIVLIVDDNAAGLRVLGVTLRNAGYQVLAVQDVGKVLPIIRSKQPDIVLLDVMMPGMNGYQVCEAIKADPAIGTTPVVFLTARSDPEDIRRGFEAGAVDFLSKPYSKIELLKRVRNHLDRHRYERHLTAEKDRFRMLTEYVAEAFLLVDRSFQTVLYANPAFERIFGLRHELFPSLLDFFEVNAVKEDRAELVANLQQAARDQTGFLHEFRMIVADSTVRWVETKIIPNPTPSADVAVCVIADITDRKIAEIKLIESIEYEADLAGIIQRTLLMNEEQIDVAGIQAVITSEPSRKVDGDFFDVYAFGDIVDVVVGDVMGKGNHAALIGAGAKTRFLRAHVAQTTGRRADGGPISPSAVLDSVNQAMAGRLVGLNSFFTVQYLRFARKQSYLEYVDCGHTPLLIWDGSDCWVYKGTSLPIGFLEDQVFTTSRIVMRPGQMVLAYSDGVTEAVGPDGEQFGEERLFQLVRRHGDGDPQALVDAIRSQVADPQATVGPSDDITIAAFKIVADAGAEPARLCRRWEFAAELAALTAVRAAVVAALAQYPPADYSDEQRDLAVLAVSEATSNVVIHGLAKDPSRRFAMLIEVWPKWFAISLRYRGEPFDWARDRVPSVLAMDERGYGLYIMRNAMHSVVHSHSDTGLLEVTLTGTTGSRDPDITIEGD